MSGMPRALLITNPQAGQRHPDTEDVATALATKYEVEMAAWGPDQSTRAAARAAAEDGFDAVFSLGGDGTARRAAAGLLGTDTALGVLPGGTANVVARSLGIGGRLLPAVRRLIAGGVIDADAGLAGNETFLMQASGGLDASAVSAVDPALKRRVGMAAYVPAAAQSWWQYEYPEIEIAVDGSTRNVAFFAACNIPYYAGPLQMAPEAGFSSRDLELVTLTRTGKWAALEFAVALATRRHTELDGVNSESVGSVVIKGPLDLRMQLDGDLFEPGYPVEVRLADEKLKLLVPVAES